MRLIVTLVLAVALAGAASSGSPRAQPIGREMPDEGREHLAEGTRATYGHYPPTSGPHWPTRAPWGVSSVPVPPEQWVHNLEHGGIVVLYRCDVPCPDVIAKLADAHRTLPRGKHGEVKLLVAPDRRIASRLALLAWRRLQDLRAFDRDRLLRFYETYVDRGPEDAP